MAALKILVLVLCVLFAGVACALEPRLSVPLIDVKPYGWLDPQGRPQGLYPDIAAALARDTGLAMDVRIVPFARAASLVAGGTADVTLMFANNFTQGKAVQAAVVFFTDQVVQLRPGLPPVARQDLAQLQIARVNGGCVELAQESGSTIKFQDLTTQDSGVRMLIAKRMDGFCTVQESLTDAINSTGSQAIFQDAQRLVLASKPVFLMVSPSMPAAKVTQLTTGLEHLQKSGELVRIFKLRLGVGYTLRLTQ